MTQKEKIACNAYKGQYTFLLKKLIVEATKLYNLNYDTQISPNS